MIMSSTTGTGATVDPRDSGTVAEDAVAGAVATLTASAGHLPSTRAECGWADPPMMRVSPSLALSLSLSPSPSLRNVPCGGRESGCLLSLSFRLLCLSVYSPLLHCIFLFLLFLTGYPSFLSSAWLTGAKKGMAGRLLRLL